MRERLIAILIIVTFFVTLIILLMSYVAYRNAKTEVSTIRQRRYASQQRLEYELNARIFEKRAESPQIDLVFVFPTPTLSFLFEQQPTNQLAKNFHDYATIGYQYLAAHDKVAALESFKKAYALTAEPRIAAQIGYTLMELQQRQEAEDFFSQCASNAKGNLKQQCEQALKQFATANTRTKVQPKRLEDEFYALKASHPKQAWVILYKILARSPNNILFLKEGGYLALQQSNLKRALPFFLKAYNLSHDASLAMQIGYILDGLDRKKQAFYFFQKALNTNQEKIYLQAQQSLINLRNWQTKLLPSPFFAELYAAPFYFSRFRLFVRPIVARTGVTINQHYAWDAYLSVRYTKDNKSGELIGAIPQIFEDNTVIYALGTRLQPFPTIPLISFLEVGKAYDLIDRGRPRWRNDVRGGLVFYNDWGALPIFSPHLTFQPRWLGSLYADTIYFSRYDNNIIGTGRLRQGLSLLTFKNASFDAYMVGYLSVDRLHEFFNNFTSFGPGIAFQPNNLYNVVFRFESLRGYYLPIKPRTPNPYRSPYHNNVATIEIFLQI